MKVIIAAVFSVALIWLAPQHTPANLNNVVRSDKTVAVRQTPLEQGHQAVVTEVATESQTEPQTTPQPEQQTVKPAAQPQGCDAYRGIFERYQWSVSTAIAVCKAESGGNTYAFSSTGDRGLMQINCVHADMVDYDLNALYDPSTNISVAYRVYLSQGWYGWSAYTNGSYLRFL